MTGFDRASEAATARDIQAVVSHASAALHHELADYLPAKTHLTVPPGFLGKLPRAASFIEQKIPMRDVEDLGGYRVTSPSNAVGSQTRSWRAGPMVTSARRGDHARAHYAQTKRDPFALIYGLEILSQPIRLSPRSRNATGQ